MPRTTPNQFGIEIEAIGLYPNEVCQHMIRAGISCIAPGYTHRTSDQWKVITDSSIEGSRTFELVSPILRGEAGLDNVRRVLQVVVDAGATLNRSCGLHVHHDAALFNGDNTKSLFNLYRTYEPVMDKLFSPSRRADVNKYCFGLTKMGILSEIRRGAPVEDVIRSVWCKYNSHLHERWNCRYHKLNLHSKIRHNTIEFRQHQATLDSIKVEAWVRFTQAMLDASRSNFLFFEDDHTPTWTNLKSILNLDANTVGFLSRRREEIAEMLSNLPQVPNFWVDHVGYMGGQESAFGVSLTNPVNNEPPKYNDSWTSNMVSTNRKIYEVTVEEGVITNIHCDTTDVDDDGLELYRHNKTNISLTKGVAVPKRVVKMIDKILNPPAPSTEAEVSEEEVPT